MRIQLTGQARMILNLEILLPAHQIASSVLLYMTRHFLAVLLSAKEIHLHISLEQDHRKQSVFLAELKSSDNRRYLRVETLICPLEDFEAEKCLRINLVLRVGYLAVGDLEGTAYVKMCENLAYKSLNAEELEYVIGHVSTMADRMEQILEGDGDIA